MFGKLTRKSLATLLLVFVALMGLLGCANDCAVAENENTEYSVSLTKKEIQDLIEAIGIYEEVGKVLVSNNLCNGFFEWGGLDENGIEKNYEPEYAGFRTADYLSVVGGRTITWNADINTLKDIKFINGIFEYDVNRQLIRTSKYVEMSVNKWDTGKAITLDQNTRYIRFCVFNGEKTVTLDSVKINIFYLENIAEFWENSGDVFKYIPHNSLVDSVGEFVPISKQQSPLTGKKVIYDGDNIAESRFTLAYNGGSYAKLIADIVNGSYENYAVGEALLTTNLYDNPYHSIVDDLSNLPLDGDLYCFEGGINDYLASVPLGTYDEKDFTGPLDTSTVCGALETIFRYSLENFAGKPICFVITHKIRNTAYDPNENGDTFKDYHDAMVGICNKYSIPYYDAFYESGLNGWNEVQSELYLTANIDGKGDGCHPNEEGYLRYYVPQLIALFERIMPR